MDTREFKEMHEKLLSKQQTLCQTQRGDEDLERLTKKRDKLNAALKSIAACIKEFSS